MGTVRGRMREMRLMTWKIFYMSMLSEQLQRNFDINISLWRFSPVVEPLFNPPKLKFPIYPSIFPESQLWNSDTSHLHKETIKAITTDAAGLSGSMLLLTTQSQRNKGGGKRGPQKPFATDGLHTGTREGRRCIPCFTSPSNSGSQIAAFDLRCFAARVFGRLS